MADQTFQEVKGIVTYVPIKIDDHFVYTDFQVIDMGEDEYDPAIILGRPFLSTVKAIIYIGTREVHMYLPSEKVRRYFTDPNYIVEDSRSGQEEDDATATRGGKSSKTDRQTMKEK